VKKRQALAATGFGRSEREDLCPRKVRPGTGCFDSPGGGIRGVAAQHCSRVSGADPVGGALAEVVWCLPLIVFPLALVLMMVALGFRVGE
jgi:hypothetical protein